MGDYKYEVSKKNRWWLPRERTLELAHYCRQYPDWKRQIKVIGFRISNVNSSLSSIPVLHEPTNKTEELAVILSEYSQAVNRIDRLVVEADEALARYILRGVTEGCPFTKLQMVYNIPCNKNTYYDRYRKFFWLLSQERGI